MELRRPGLADEQAVLDLMREYEASNSPQDGFFCRSALFDYDAWLLSNLRFEVGLDLPEGFVPAIQFVSFDEKGHALGFLHLRLSLNALLLEKGGHIGYSIRPSERGKGYAKEQLTLALQECQAKNIRRVLLTCDRRNSVSRSVILSQSAVLEDTRAGIERYWIDLEKTSE